MSRPYLHGYLDFRWLSTFNLHIQRGAIFQSRRWRMYTWWLVMHTNSIFMIHRILRSLLEQYQYSLRLAYKLLSSTSKVPSDFVSDFSSRLSFMCKIFFIYSTAKFRCDSWCKNHLWYYKGCKYSKNFKLPAANWLKICLIVSAS